MEQFYALMRSVGMPCFPPAENDDVDIIGRLPVEVSVNILRLLDAESLVSAALVNKQWSHICQTDRKLRRRVYLHLRHERRNIFKSLEKCQPKVIREPSSSGNSTTSRPFSHRNERFKTQMSEHREILHILPHQDSAQKPELSGVRRPCSAEPQPGTIRLTHTSAVSSWSSVGIQMPTSNKLKMRRKVTKSKRKELLQRPKGNGLRL